MKKSKKLGFLSGILIITACSIIKPTIEPTKNLLKVKNTKNFNAKSLDQEGLSQEDFCYANGGSPSYKDSGIKEHPYKGCFFYLKWWYKANRNQDYSGLDSIMCLNNEGKYNLFGYDDPNGGKYHQASPIFFYFDYFYRFFYEFQSNVPSGASRINSSQDNFIQDLHNIERPVFEYETCHYSRTPDPDSSRTPSFDSSGLPTFDSSAYPYTFEPQTESEALKDYFTYRSSDSGSRIIQSDNLKETIPGTNIQSKLAYEFTYAGKEPQISNSGRPIVYPSGFPLPNPNVTFPPINGIPLNPLAGNGLGNSDLEKQLYLDHDNVNIDSIKVVEFQGRYIYGWDNEYTENYVSKIENGNLIITGTVSGVNPSTGNSSGGIEGTFQAIFYIGDKDGNVKATYPKMIGKMTFTYPNRVPQELDVSYDGTYIRSEPHHLIITMKLSQSLKPKPSSTPTPTPEDCDCNTPTFSTQGFRIEGNVSCSPPPSSGITCNNEPKVFDSSCFSDHSVYDIPLVYNFDNEGADLTFISVLTNNYFSSHNQQGLYNLLPIEYQNILKGGNNEFSIIQDNISITLDKNKVNLINGSHGWDSDESTQFYAFVSKDKKTLNYPLNPFDHETFLQGKRNNEKYPFYPWADLVSRKYPLKKSQVLPAPDRNQYYQLVSLAVDLKSEYDKFIDPNTKKPIPNKKGKLKISYWDKKSGIKPKDINFTIGLNSKIKQGRKYKWELSCN